MRFRSCFRKTSSLRVDMTNDSTACSISCKTLFSAHSGIVGLVIAPMMLLGGPLVLRAAAYTAGTVAALSLTAACAPDEKFLTWGGPLSLALGGICVACIGELCVLF